MTESRHAALALHPVETEDGGVELLKRRQILRRVRWAALAVLLLLGLQLVLMDHFLDKVHERAILYSGFGVPLFVAGMMVSAFALRTGIRSAS